MWNLPNGSFKKMLQNISHLFLDGTGNVIFGNSSSEERMGGIV